MRLREFQLGALASAVAIGLWACSPQGPGEPQTGTLTDSAERRPDSQVATAVEAALYGSDEVRGSDIDVSVEDGVVTLQGAAANEAARQQAMAVAKTVEGVTQVQDRMIVRPSQTAEAERGQQPAGTTGTAGDERNPFWITTQIQARYFISPEVKPWNIDVTARPNGVVELRGEVDEPADRVEAVRIARETDGVTRVDDQLRVRGEQPTPAAPDAGAGTGTTAALNEIDNDAWLTAKVQSKYFLDDDVKALDVDVETVDGVVTLRGTVDSARERRQAIALARNTEGVRDVRDELRVESTASEEAGGATAVPRNTTATGIRAAVDDAWITTKIQSQYFLDREVKGHEIDVDTRNATVTLSGSVEAEAQKQLAEQIARETEGVSRVVNKLTVSAPSQ